MLQSTEGKVFELAHGEGISNAGPGLVQDVQA